MAGRSTDPEPIPGLESLGFGMGSSHMAVLSQPCGMCNGTREITEGTFTIACPCSVVIGGG